jgi:hypothetical protein
MMDGIKLSNIAGSLWKVDEAAVEKDVYEE